MAEYNVSLPPRWRCILLRPCLRIALELLRKFELLQEYVDLRSAHHRTLTIEAPLAAAGCFSRLPFAWRNSSRVRLCSTTCVCLLLILFCMAVKAT